MSTVAVFLADGFEEIEALTVVDLCRRAGLETPMVSVKEGKTVNGSHGIFVVADKMLADVDFEAVDMIVLPGGMPGTLNLEACAHLMEQVKDFYAKGKYISAICAAPTVFAHLGLLEGRNACCYPAMEGDMAGAKVSQNPVEISEHVTTSRGMGTAMDLGLTIVERFKGKETADKLAEAVVYKRA